MATARVRRTSRATAPARPHLSLVGAANPEGWKQNLEPDELLRHLAVGTEEDIKTLAVVERIIEQREAEAEEKLEEKLAEELEKREALISSLFDALATALDDRSFERLDDERFYERINDIHIVISHLDSRPEFTFEEAAERAGKKIPQA